MGEPILQLGNATNWRFLDSKSLDAPVNPAHPTALIPIPPINIGVLIDSPIIAVTADSDKKQPTWHRAGIIKQKANIGIEIGSSRSAVSEARTVYFGEPNLVRFTSLTKDYELVFIPFPWLLSIQVSFYQYIGTISDTHDELLIRTDQKINRLINAIEVISTNPDTPNYLKNPADPFGLF